MKYEKQMLIFYYKAAFIKNNLNVTLSLECLLNWVLGERFCFYISEDLISQHLHSAKNYLKIIISLTLISL